MAVGVKSNYSCGQISPGLIDSYESSKISTLRAIRRGKVARAVQIALVASFAAFFFLDLVLYSAKALGWFAAVISDASSWMKDSLEPIRLFFKIPPAEEILPTAWETYILWPPEYAWVVILAGCLLPTIAFRGIPRWFGPNMSMAKRNRSGFQSHLTPRNRTYVVSGIYMVVAIGIWSISCTLVPDSPLFLIVIAVALTFPLIMVLFSKLVELIGRVIHWMRVSAIGRELAATLSRGKRHDIKRNMRVIGVGLELVVFGMFWGVNWVLNNADFAFPLFALISLVGGVIYAQYFHSKHAQKWRSLIVEFSLFIGIFLIWLNIFPRDPLGALFAGVAGLILHRPRQSVLTLVKVGLVTKAVFTVLCWPITRLYSSLARRPRICKALGKLAAITIRVGGILIIFLLIMWATGGVFSPMSGFACLGTAIGFIVAGIFVRFLPILVNSLRHEVRDLSIMDLASAQDDTNKNKYPQFVIHTHEHKNPFVDRGVNCSRKVSRGTSMRTMVMGLAILSLFGGQLIASLPSWDFGGEPIKLANTEGTEWLTLTHSDISGSSMEDPCFKFYACNRSYLLFETMDGAAGCDYASMYFGDGENEPQFCQGQAGFNWYSYKFATEVWDPVLGAAGTTPSPHLYNVTIPADFKNYLKWVTMQPLVLAEGGGHVDTSDEEVSPLQFSFKGAGPVAIIILGNLSYPTLSCKIDSKYLKESEPTQLNVSCSVVSNLIQGSPSLAYETHLEAGMHTVELDGKGDIAYLCITNLDTDGDKLSDLDEFRKFGWDALEALRPNAYGYLVEQTSTDELSPGEDLIYGYWSRVSFKCFIPQSYYDQFAPYGNDLYALAVSGKFTNFTVDLDNVMLNNVTLTGYGGDSLNEVVYCDESGTSTTIAGEDILYTERQYIGDLGAGEHVISFGCWNDLFTEPKIFFELNDELIPILSISQESDPEDDEDDDGLISSEDASQIYSLTCNKGTITQLVLPYTKYTEKADVRVDFSVKPPSIDYSTPVGELVDWHGLNTYDPWGRLYDEPGHLQCSIRPAMRIIGPGDDPDLYQDYWDNNAELEAYWQEPVNVYSIVDGYNAAGHDCDYLPVAGDEAGYYTMVYPSMVNSTWTYSGLFPASSKALADRVLSIHFEFVWVVIAENAVNGTSDIIHVYQSSEDYIIQAIVMEEIFNASVIYGTPNNFVESQSLWSIVQNPNLEGRDLVSSQILAEYYNIPYYEQNFYNNELDFNSTDPFAGMGIVDRVARMRNIVETYRFTNCLAGTLPKEWTMYGYNGAEIAENFYGQDKVIKITQAASSSSVSGATRHFGDVYSGSVDWRMLVPQTASGSVVGSVVATLSRDGDPLYRLAMVGQDVYFNGRFIGKQKENSWGEFNVGFNAETDRCYIYMNHTLISNNTASLGHVVPNAFSIECAPIGMDYFSAIDNITIVASRVSSEKAEAVYYSTRQTQMDVLHRINHTILTNVNTGDVYLHFPATYDFGLGRPRDVYVGVWDHNFEGGAYVSQQPQLGLHKDVLVFRDLDFAEPAWARLQFGESREEGTISFWLQGTDTKKPYSITFCEDALGNIPGAIRLRIINGMFQWYNGSSDWVYITNCSNNLWYRIEVTWNTANFSIYITGGAYGYVFQVPYPEESNPSLINPFLSIKFATDAAATGYFYYLDSVGLGWDEVIGTSENDITLDDVFANCFEDMVSWFDIIDKYNGTLQPDDPALQGGQVELYKTYYNELGECAKRINIKYWPLKLELVHTWDVPNHGDGYESAHLLEVTFASDTINFGGLESLVYNELEPYADRYNVIHYLEGAPNEEDEIFASQQEETLIPSPLSIGLTSGLVSGLHTADISSVPPVFPSGHVAKIPPKLNFNLKEIDLWNLQIAGKWILDPGNLPAKPRTQLLTTLYNYLADPAVPWSAKTDLIVQFLNKQFVRTFKAVSRLTDEALQQAQIVFMHMYNDYVSGKSVDDKTCLMMFTEFGDQHIGLKTLPDGSRELVFYKKINVKDGGVVARVRAGTVDADAHLYHIDTPKKGWIIEARTFSEAISKNQLAKRKIENILPFLAQPEDADVTVQAAAVLDPDWVHAHGYDSSKPLQEAIEAFRASDPRFADFSVQEIIDAMPPEAFRFFIEEPEFHEFSVKNKAWMDLCPAVMKRINVECDAITRAYMWAAVFTMNAYPEEALRINLLTEIKGLKTGKVKMMLSAKRGSQWIIGQLWGPSIKYVRPLELGEDFLAKVTAEGYLKGQDWTITDIKGQSVPVGKLIWHEDVKMELPDGGTAIVNRRVCFLDPGIAGLEGPAGVYLLPSAVYGDLEMREELGTLRLADAPPAVFSILDRNIDAVEKIIHNARKFYGFKRIYDCKEKAVTELFETFREIQALCKGMHSAFVKGTSRRLDFGSDTYIGFGKHTTGRGYRMFEIHIKFQWPGYGKPLDLDVDVWENKLKPELERMIEFYQKHEMFGFEDESIFLRLHDIVKQKWTIRQFYFGGESEVIKGVAQGAGRESIATKIAAYRNAFGDDVFFKEFMNFMMPHYKTMSSSLKSVWDKPTKFYDFVVVNGPRDAWQSLVWEYQGICKELNDYIESCITRDAAGNIIDYDHLALRQYVVTIDGRDFTTYRLDATRENYYFQRIKNIREQMKVLMDPRVPYNRGFEGLAGHAPEVGSDGWGHFKPGETPEQVFYDLWLKYGTFSGKAKFNSIGDNFGPLGIHSNRYNYALLFLNDNHVYTNRINKQVAPQRFVFPEGGDPTSFSGGLAIHQWDRYSQVARVFVDAPEFKSEIMSEDALSTRQAQRTWDALVRRICEYLDQCPKAIDEVFGLDKNYWSFRMGPEGGALDSEEDCYLRLKTLADFLQIHAQGKAQLELDRLAGVSTAKYCEIVGWKGRATKAVEEAEYNWWTGKTGDLGARANNAFASAWFGLLLDITMDLLQGDLFRFYDQRLAEGWSSSDAFMNTLVRFGVPWLLEAITDLLFVDALCGAISSAVAGLFSTAASLSSTMAAGSALASWCAPLAIAMAVASVITYVWQYYCNIYDQARRSIKYEHRPTILFPFETNRTFLIHGGLEIGNIIEVKTTIANFGQFWKTDGVVAQFTGGDFAFHSMYAVAPVNSFPSTNEWTPVEGSWSNDGDPYAEEACAIHNLVWNRIWPGDFYVEQQNQSLTYSQYPLIGRASADPELWSWAEFATFIDSNPYTSDSGRYTTERLGLPIFENSIEAFLSATAPIKLVTLENLLDQYENATANYQWRDAYNLANEIAGKAGDDALLTLDQLNALRHRKYELGSIGAPLGYETSSGTYVPFTDEQILNYDLLMTYSEDEFASYLYPGSAYMAAGFRAVNPDWDAAGYQHFVQDWDWVIPYSYQKEYPWGWETVEANFASGCLEQGWTCWATGQESGVGTVRDGSLSGNQVLQIADNDLAEDPACGAAKPFAETSRGHVKFSIKSIVTTDMPFSFGLYYQRPDQSVTDDSLIPVAALDVKYKGWEWGSYYEGGLYFGSYRIGAWTDQEIPVDIYFDCERNWVQVQLNYQVVYEGSVLCTNRLPNVFRIKTEPWYTDYGIWLDDLEMWFEKNDAISHACSYYDTNPSGQIFIPKTFWQESRYLLDISENFTRYGEELPCQTNFIPLRSWEGVLTVWPSQTYEGSYNFILDGPIADDDLVIDIDGIVSPGFKLNILNKPGTLADLRFDGIAWRLCADPDAVAGSYYLRFSITNSSGYVIYSDNILFRYGYNSTLDLEFINGTFYEELPLGTDYTWADILNLGNIPEDASVYIDGTIPYEWLRFGHYVPIQSFDFDTGLEGWSVSQSSLAPEWTFVGETPITQFTYVSSSAPFRNFGNEGFGANMPVYFQVPECPSAIHGGAVSAYATFYAPTYARFQQTRIYSTDGSGYVESSITWANRPSPLSPALYTSAYGFSYNRIDVANLQPGKWYYMEGDGVSFYSDDFADPALRPVVVFYSISDAPLKGEIVLAGEGVSATCQTDVSVRPGDRLRLKLSLPMTDSKSYWGYPEEISITAGEVFTISSNSRVAGTVEKIFTFTDYRHFTSIRVNSNLCFGKTMSIDAVYIERAPSHYDIIDFLDLRSGDLKSIDITANFATDSEIMSSTNLIPHFLSLSSSEPDSTGVLDPIYVGTSGNTNYVALLALQEASFLVTQDLDVNLTIYVKSCSMTCKVTAFAAEPFDPSSVTWNNAQDLEGELDSIIIHPGYTGFVNFVIPAIKSQYLCLILNNTGLIELAGLTAEVGERPLVSFAAAKVNLLNNGLVMTSNTTISERIEAIHIGAVNVTSGDILHAEFQCLTDGPVYLNLSVQGITPLIIPLITELCSSPELRAITYEFTEVQNYTAIALVTFLKLWETFNLTYFEVLRPKSHGSSFSSVKIGGFYDQTCEYDDFTTWDNLIRWDFNGDVGRWDIASYASGSDTIYLPMQYITNAASIRNNTPTENYGQVGWLDVDNYNASRTFIEIPEPQSHYLLQLGTTLYMYSTAIKSSVLGQPLDWLIYACPTSSSFIEDELTYKNAPWAALPAYNISLNAEDNLNGWIAFKDLHIGTLQLLSLNASTKGGAMVSFASDENLDGYRPYISQYYPKIGTTSGYLVLQSDVAETITLSTDTIVSMDSGCLVRIRYRENCTGDVSLNMGSEIFYLGHSGSEQYSGWQEKVFVFDSTEILNNIRLVAALAVNEQVLIDYIVIEKSGDLPEVCEYVPEHRDVLLLDGMTGHAASVEYIFGDIVGYGTFNTWIDCDGEWTIDFFNGESTISIGCEDDVVFMQNDTERIYTNASSGGWMYLSLTFNNSWVMEGEMPPYLLHNYTLRINNHTVLFGSNLTMSKTALITNNAWVRISVSNGSKLALDAPAWSWDSSYTSNGSFIQNFREGVGNLLEFEPGEWTNLILSLPPRLYTTPAALYDIFARVYGSDGTLLGVYSRQINTSFFDSCITLVDVTDQVVQMPVTDGQIQYNFVLKNLGNVPQEYKLSVSQLDYASPRFMVGGITTSTVNLAAGGQTTITLFLDGVVEGCCNFSLSVDSITSGHLVKEIPLSFVANVPPRFTNMPQKDQTLLVGVPNPILAWTHEDYSVDIYGRGTYLLYESADTGNFLGTHTFPDVTYENHEEAPTGWTWQSHMFENPSNWGYAHTASMIDYGPGGSFKIDSLVPHEGYMFLSDNHYDEIYGATFACNAFTSQASGTVEWWVGRDALGHTFSDSGLFKDGVPVSMIRVFLNHVEYGGQTIANIDPSCGWIHLRVDFGATGCDIYVNSRLAVAGADLLNSVTPNEFRIIHGGGEGSVALDALGYSWDPSYAIGDNWLLASVPVSASQWGLSEGSFSYEVPCPGPSDGMLASYGRWDRRFTLVVDDALGGSSASTTNLHILNPAPQFTEWAGDVTWEMGSVPPVLQWMVMDSTVLNPTYAVYCAASEDFLQSEDYVQLIATGSWTSGEPIIAQALPATRKNVYKLVVADGYGFTATDLAYVWASNTRPVFTQSPEETSIEVETGQASSDLNWVAQDTSLFQNPYGNPYLWPLTPSYRVVNLADWPGEYNEMPFSFREGYAWFPARLGSSMWNTPDECVSIEDEYAGHANVLRLMPEDKTNPAYATGMTAFHIFEDATYGTFEWWAYINILGTLNEGSECKMWASSSAGDSAGEVWGLHFQQDGTLHVRDGDTYFSAGTWSSNTWHHFSVDFDLRTQQWSLVMDGVELLANGHLGPAGIAMKNFRVQGFLSYYPNWEIGIDAPGLYADGLDRGYLPGDNLQLYDARVVIAEGPWDGASPVTFTLGDLAPGTYDRLTLEVNDGFAWVAAPATIWTVVYQAAPRVTAPAPVSIEYGTGASLQWNVWDLAYGQTDYRLYSEGQELPGHYYGVESWTNAESGSQPDGWFYHFEDVTTPTKIITHTYYSQIVDEYIGHKNVLKIDHCTETYIVFPGTPDEVTYVTDGFTSLTHSFPAASAGTIEWYIVIPSGGSRVILEGTELGLALMLDFNGNGRIITSNGKYYNPYLGTIYQTKDVGAWSPHEWIRVSISFSCASQMYSISINGQTTGNLMFYGDQTVANVYSLTIWPNVDFTPFYFDAFGYDWDMWYAPGDNLLFDRNRVLVGEGAWSIDVPVSMSLNEYLPGSYRVTLVADDGMGHWGRDYTNVEIYNIAPTLATSPADVIFLVGTLASSMEWTPSDASTLGATYRVLEEGMGEMASGTWVSGVPIAWNPSGLPMGEHHILLELDDGLGGTLEDQVIVKSNDHVTFLNTPHDFSYHVGDAPFNIGWTVSDLLGLNPKYNVFIRGFEGESGIGGPFITDGSWASGPATSITVDFSGKPAGLYLASMVVSDGLGTQTTDQVVFCVTPEGMSPLDWLEAQLVEAGSDMTCGTSSGEVTVDVTFDTAEDTQVAIGIWDAPPQPLGPDFATEGTYFTVDAEREAAVTFPIYVTVTLPGGFPVGMTESDVAAWLRLLTFDEASGAWIDSHFAIVEIDMVAGTATFEVLHLSTFALGFANGLPPKIDGPGDLTYEYGSLGPQYISWRLADLTLGPDPTYAVLLNGVVKSQGSWSFGSDIIIDAAGLPVGTYNYEIIAFDDLGGVSSHGVPVSIYNGAPTISAPLNVTYEAGSNGNVVTWVPEDLSTSNPSYTVTIDAAQVSTGTWMSGASISVPVDGLMPGWHVVEMVLADGLGASVTDQVCVVVTNKEPVITAPPPITYEEGDPRPVASWLIEDSSVLAGTFDLLRDGTLVSSGAWSSGIPFEVNVGGLAPGTFTYQLVARDGYGAVNDALATVIVLPDDDAGVFIADLNATATSFNATVTFADVDSSGIASVDWVTVNGTAIANFTAVVAGGHWVVTFDHAFPRDGLYVVELQVTDADADRPSDQSSQVFAARVNVTGCDPVKTLMEGVLIQIDLLQVEIDRVDCWVWRELLAFFAGRAESSMVKALDLYLAGDVPAATVRVWVAQCATHVDGILVRVGEMIGIIDSDLAVELGGHISSIQADLSAILQLLPEAG